MRCARSVSIGLALVLLLTGLCVGVAGQKYGGTLKVGMPGGFDVLDPHKTTLSNYDSTMRYTVFETLLNVTPGTAELGPQLATSWEWLDDRTLEFKLRSGVLFHSGETFSADDVAFSINRIKNPDTGSQYRSTALSIDRVEVVDGLTVRFHYTGDIAKGGALWALPYMQILNEAGIATIDSAPVGTGPFKFVSWIPGTEWILERYDSYWDSGLPYVDRIKFTAIEDSETRTISLLTGDIDMLGAGAVPYKDMVRLEADPNTQVVAPPGGGFVNLNYNVLSDGPIGNPLVRRAVSCAIDRVDYVENVIYGSGQASVGLLAPENPFYSRVLDATYGIHRNLDLAARFLEEAGYPGGRGLELEIISIAGIDLMEQLCLLLQQNLGEIGVTLRISNLDVGGWIDRLLGGNYEISANFYEEGMIGDPNILLSGDSVGPGYNVSQYYAQDYVDAAAAALITPDFTPRKALYDELQAILARDMPFTIICQLTHASAVRTDVKDYMQGSMRVPYFKNVWLDR